MEIYPAIDIRGGHCVRLQQGDYAQEIDFGDDPAAMALNWINQGARFLHIVDLDGARERRPINGVSIRRIAEVCRTNNVSCQMGGGLRYDDDIQEVLAWGVTRVIIGTRALQSPEWFEGVCRKFSGKIVLGIDAKDGKVATDGWLKVSDKTALGLAQHCASFPLAAIVYTDISRDGMLQGANVEAMGEMAAAVKVPVIASGGVTTEDDIRRLAERKLAGCIVGRALYEGKLDLQRAITVAGIV